MAAGVVVDNWVSSSVFLVEVALFKLPFLTAPEYEDRDSSATCRASAARTNPETYFIGM